MAAENRRELIETRLADQSNTTFTFAQASYGMKPKIPPFYPINKHKIVGCGCRIQSKPSGPVAVADRVAYFVIQSL
jgi:hypothetical protein